MKACQQKERKREFRKRHCEQQQQKRKMYAQHRQKQIFIPQEDRAW